MFTANIDNIVKIGLKSRGNQIDAVRALLKTNDFLNMLLNYLSQSHYIYHDTFFSEGPVLKVRFLQAHHNLMRCKWLDSVYYSFRVYLIVLLTIKILKCYLQRWLNYVNIEKLILF